MISNKFRLDPSETVDLSSFSADVQALDWVDSVSSKPRWELCRKSSASWLLFDDFKFYVDFNTIGMGACVTTVKLSSLKLKHKFFTCMLAVNRMHQTHVLNWKFCSIHDCHLIRGGD